MPRICNTFTISVLSAEFRSGKTSGRFQAVFYASDASQQAASKTTLESPEKITTNEDGSKGQKHTEPGSLARRLEEATEETLLTGGAAGQRAVEDAGFSDELKERLFDKIADAKFRKQYAGAFAQTEEGGRQHEAAQPWSGQETTEGAVRRMLDDAVKPLKPELRGKFQPPVIDTRIKRPKRVSPGQRAASAKERASAYTGMGIKDSKGLSDAEREELKQEFRDRFGSAARAVPNTISGLTALANERIEEAIARGQFKNLPRGQKDVRDPRADNPFIDTTEYLMNRIIQRQEIVPPWIEKQQELVKAAHSFRSRLRNDWKRHVSRMIASQGGSLFEQMKQAELYAMAEKLHNPRQKTAEQIVVPIGATEDPVMIKMRLQAEQEAKAEEGALSEAMPISKQEAEQLPPPYRDPAWVATEQAYLNLSIKTLNDLARSYNLMAPDLAKKPYYSLQRELAACYSDVAPLIANEIKDRAAKPPPRAAIYGGGVFEKSGSGIMGHFGSKDDVRVHLEAEDKAYGFKEWWRDMWKKS